jgi:hypothetical protein
MASNILLICGSLNQTTMMHQIARCLPEHHCYFTPFYAEGLLGFLSRKGMLDFTILGGNHLKNTRAYLAEHHLPVDFGGRARFYDAVITCTDLILQSNIRGKRLILVQEGMIEPEGMLYHLVRLLKLPRFLANTATTGLSDAYDLFCVASAGYRDLFIQKGVRPEKIAVTGIPNFDHASAYMDNNFPYRDFVLAATSCARETFKPDDRPAFIRQVLQIANGRQVIFKLHPNENFARAIREIHQLAPGALVYTDGNVNHMIANCSVLVTQYSSVVFIGLALGKEVYSYLDLDLLRRLTPVQNGGLSSQRIAELCRQLLHMPASELAAVRAGHLRRPAWKLPDAA